MKQVRLLLGFLMGFHSISFAQCAEVTELKALTISNSEVELQFQAPLNPDNQSGNVYRKYCGSYQVQYRSVAFITETDTLFGKPDSSWRLFYFGFSDNRTAMKTTSVINLQPGCRYEFRVNTRCNTCNSSGALVTANTLYENPITLIAGKAEQTDAWVMGIVGASPDAGSKELRLIIAYRAETDHLWQEREWAMPVAQVRFGKEMQRSQTYRFKCRILFENGVYSKWSRELSVQLP